MQAFGDVFGITSAMFCLVGFIATWFDTLWSKDEKISIIIMVILSTLFFEFGSYFIKSLVSDFELEIAIFFRILAIEELYNILLTIIFFGTIKKLRLYDGKKTKKK